MPAGIFFKPRQMNLDRYNERITQAAVELVSEAKATASALGISHRANSPSKGSSVAKIKGAVKYRDGSIDRIVLRFPRNLIWTMKGAGKGMGASKGSRWIDKYGNTKQTDPRSLGKAGSGSRTPKPAIEGAIMGSHGVDHIATIAAEEIGSTISNNLFIN
jgi:hypothetical protein